MESTNSRVYQGSGNCSLFSREHFSACLARQIPPFRLHSTVALCRAGYAARKPSESTDGQHEGLSPPAAKVMLPSESAGTKSQPPLAQRRPLLLSKHEFRIDDDLGFGDLFRPGVQGQGGTQWRRSEEPHLEAGCDEWDGRPVLSFPASLIGLPHDDGGCVTVEERRDDPTVEEAEPIVVLVKVATVRSPPR